MQSNGGGASPLESSRKASEPLLSGPAGEVGGAKFLTEKRVPRTSSLST